jgi:beta-xylosidase
MMRALDDFDVTVTFCFTPEHRGLAPHHTSPPAVAAEFAEFCGSMIRRYGAGGSETRDNAAAPAGPAGVP